MNERELAVVKYLNNLWKGKIDFATEAISNIAILMAFWISALTLGMWFFPERRFVLLGQVLVVAFLHFVISELFFKYILPHFVEVRKRPFSEYPEEIVPIGYQFSYGSMPSSHMSSSAAMAVTLVSVFPILFWPAVLFLIFMAFARLHNGMHYPSDIIAGLVLGLSYGFFAIKLIV
ncbi:MAG: hypothetical protein ACD_11C00090G0010 [uncultured bacterium]|nr:MAG: hypothetical protein ACD_11C00090G0010 [uncultured bacterium]HBR71746.1 hypothetical protein [Candidatus Moranbacteria bacterium]